MNISTLDRFFNLLFMETPRTRLTTEEYRFFQLIPGEIGPPFRDPSACITAVLVIVAGYLDREFTSNLGAYCFPDGTYCRPRPPSSLLSFLLRLGLALPIIAKVEVLRIFSPWAHPNC